MSVNKVILIGNLGSDPEVRHLDNDSVVARVNIATTEKYRNRDGELVSNTEWHRLEIWNGLAKVAEQYLRKGSQVYVEGKLKTEEYKDKEGNQRRSTIVRVLNLTLLGRRSDTDSNNQNMSNQSPNQTANEADASYNTESESNDDLPF